MAIITRGEGVFYKAHWTDFSGTQRSKMTSQRDYQRAIKQACEFEAEDWFHRQANEGVFDFMASNGLSPDGCYQNFTHKAHMKRDRFKQLCRQVKIQFLSSKEWIDKKKGQHSSKRRYRWHNKLMFLDEIMSEEGCSLSVSTVRARLKKGMALEEAINTPLNSEASLKAR